ncbi:MAG: VWA domain-containing protein [Verrucomicrobiota bacterium]|nr:VWA domain-containing protein [Verrucomicrobiota bacterium]
MRFAHPYLLLLLLLIPLVAWLKSKKNLQSAFIYSSVQMVKGVVGIQRGSVGKILLRMRWLSLALLIIALARPQWTEGSARIKASGIDILIALDLSTSMAAEDFVLEGEPVNRLVVAKRMIEEFVRQRASDRIGLVAFAGRAYIAAPLTLDHDFFQQNLNRLQLGSLEDGTAIGSGLTAALNRLRELQSKSKLVILMTDGVNNAGKVPPLTAAEAAQALGIKVYTIGVGTHGVARVPAVDVFGRRVYRQEKVEIDEETLTEVARRTGGRYYRADSSETLRKVYAEIDQLEKTDAEVKKFERYRELFHWFALPGTALLLLELILANTVWRRLP